MARASTARRSPWRAAPTKAGYTFTGWSDGTTVYAAGATYTLASDGSAIVFTAQWTANASDAYSYNTAGGSTAPAGGSGLDGTSITLAPAPTKAGYTFTGWTDGTTVYAAGATYTLNSDGSAIVFTAQWTANASDAYSYNTAGGSTAPAGGSGLDGTTITLAPAPTKAGYTFTGWSDGTTVYAAGATYTLNSDGSAIVFTAQWTANASDAYSYNTAGGSTAPAGGSGLDGTTITLAPAPTKAGYTFTGWSDGTTVYAAGATYTLASDGSAIVFTAQWTANASDAYSYNTAGGSTAPAGGSGLDGTTITLAPAPTKAGYTFTGWSDGTTVYAAGATYTLASDGSAIVFTAQWTANASDAYSYNTAGGSTAPAGGSGLDGTTITLAPAPTKAGYTFTGWSDGTTVYAAGATYTLASDGSAIVFTAQWTANAIQTYTVTFNASGGTGSMSSESFTAGQSQALTLNTFTRANYTFGGWATSAGGPVVYGDQQSITVTGNETLYAVWIPITYTVTFNANGGTGSMSSQTFDAGQGQALTLNTFTRTYYTFGGWATSAGGPAVFGDQQTITVTGSETLYAVWNPITYTVTFNADGGAGSMSSQIFDAGQSQALTLNTFTRAGYTFAGWGTTPLSGVVFFDQQTITVTGSETLYAIWTANKVTTVTVSFNSEGGSAVSSISGPSGSTITLPTAPTFAGHTFKGWFVAASGGTALTSPYTLSTSTTLYAQWSVESPLSQSPSTLKVAVR